LINYWAFTNNVKDSIGTAHLYNGVNASLTHDRFGYDNSALRLNSGYYSVPSGVYFNGPFTTSVWVNAKSYGFSARVFDFGVNGWNSDNIIFGLFKENSAQSFFQIYNGNTYTSILYCNSAIALNEWIHVAVTFDGSQAKIYFNGIFSGSSPQSSPQNVVRQTNFIGESNWSFYGDALANVVYDELRIYNRVLTQNEINALMYY
jgi:arabinan endo-1,5-alpha-L-arabinosidase